MHHLKWASYFRKWTSFYLKTLQNVQFQLLYLHFLEHNVKYSNLERFGLGCNFALDTSHLCFLLNCQFLSSFQNLYQLPLQIAKHGTKVLLLWVWFSSGLLWLGCRWVIWVVTPWNCFSWYENGVWGVWGWWPIYFSFRNLFCSMWKKLEVIRH